MDNVVSFPRKNLGPMMSDQDWETFLAKADNPPIFHDLIPQFTHTKYMEDFPKVLWDVHDVFLGVDKSNPSYRAIIFSTRYREHFIPSYPQAGTVNFLLLEHEPVEKSADSVVIPNDLLSQMAAHFGRYPSVVAYGVMICYAILSLLVERSDLSLLKVKEGDEFCVEFLQKVEDSYFKFTFTVDFLPLLLDHTADMKMQEDEDSKE